jgi:hypothetical protein
LKGRPAKQTFIAPRLKLPPTPRLNNLHGLRDTKLFPDAGMDLVYLERFIAERAWK